MSVPPHNDRPELVTEHQQRGPMVIAHRGASGYRPEHSRSAYRLAIAMGADALEPDLVVSKDGELVIRHDNELSDSTDVASRPEFRDRATTKLVDGEQLTGWFTEDFTWAEIASLRTRERLPHLRPDSAAHDEREGVLRLEDLLDIVEQAERSVALVIEIKHATYFRSKRLDPAPIVSEKLARWSNARNVPIIFESFEKTVLRHLRDRGVGVGYVYLHDLKGAAADEVAQHGTAAPSFALERTTKFLEQLRRTCTGVSLPTKIVMAGVSFTENQETLARSAAVDRAHSAGLDVFSWTLRPERAFLRPQLRRPQSGPGWGNWEPWFRAVMRSGVDGVFADHPDLALQVRKML